MQIDHGKKMLLRSRLKQTFTTYRKAKRGLGNTGPKTHDRHAAYLITFDLAFQEILACNIARSGNALQTRNGKLHPRHYEYYSLYKIQYPSKHA